MVSQAAIARALDVSVMTVSRALRNHPDLSESTKGKILEMAASMGYARPQAAPQKEHRLAQIAVLVYESTAGASSRTQFGSIIPQRIFRAVQAECRRQQVEATVEFLQPGESPLSGRNAEMKGMLLFGRYSKEVLDALPKEKPALAVSSYLPGLPLPHISADNLHGMQIVTEHLIGLGHKEILYWSNEDAHSDIFKERERGYRLAMALHGLKPTVHAWDVARSPRESLDWKAIVCAADSCAYHLQRSLRDSGFQAGRDYHLAGFDNSIDGQWLTDCTPVTSYEPEWDMMGRLAVLNLLNPLAPLGREGLHIVVPGRLLVRASTSNSR